jgi:hypothetical protein
MLLPLLGERAGVRTDVILDVMAAPEESCFIPCYYPLKTSKNLKTEMDSEVKRQRIKS